MNNINKENLASFFKEKKEDASVLKMMAREENGTASIDMVAEFDDERNLHLHGHSFGNRLLVLIALGEILTNIAADVERPVSEVIVDFLAINADTFDKFDSES